jgi:hypothetical protein
MKYINRIVNGNVNIDSMVINKPILRQLTILLSLPVAVFGLISLGGMLPIAGVVDSTRYARLQYYRYTKVQRKQSYVNNILASMDIPVKGRRNMIKIITKI